MIDVDVANRLFDVVDANKTGRLTRAEVKAACARGPRCARCCARAATRSSRSA